MSSSLAAVFAIWASDRWVYMFIVVVIEAWPTSFMVS